jgi:alpha-mannosidase
MNNETGNRTKDTIHLISHTHWDREWYFSFQHFRYRLVYLVNQLLDHLPGHPNFRYFHMDGQSIAVEDYLEAEPERREELLGHIREGRILIGPWYVLADEFLVSGESLIRNLLLGHDQCSQFGGKMNIGYLPDLFGHISQMPQILKGFGLEEAVLWRGVSDRNGERVPCCATR